MISGSIFTANGTVYPQSTVFDSHAQLNQTALNEVGLPYFAGSSVWGYLANNLAVIVHFLISRLLTKNLRILDRWDDCPCRPFLGPIHQGVYQTRTNE